MRGKRLLNGECGLRISEEIARTFVLHNLQSAFYNLQSTIGSRFLLRKISRADDSHYRPGTRMNRLPGNLTTGRKAQKENHSCHIFWL